MAEEGASTSSDDSPSSPELHNSAPKKNVVPKAMKQKVKSSHPSTAEMVNEAIVQLGERSGSSLLAIKKFIMTTYNLDVDKLAIYIKKYLKSAVANGSLLQTKGRGASGSFKMPSAKQKAAMAKAALEEQSVPPAKKPVAPKKTESSGKVATAAAATMKKQASSKQIVKKAASSTVVRKTKSAKQIADTATPPKSPSRTKKMAKSPTSKPKAPKPKKVTAASKSPRAVAPKKMTAVKK